jgi:D-alanyl-D-alanine carboxypeptidase/D-alanyl-D-alanine-endopeptidase (penicillin-binding protein 4)
MTSPANSKTLFLCFVVLIFAVGGLAQREKVAPNPIQTVTPLPNPKPSPTMQTLTDLQARIRGILQRQILRRGQIGIKIVSLDSGKTIYDENSEKYFVPASNMKSFTVAAALDRLTPDFRFVTSVYAAAKPDANGVIKGDLIIYGRGDPSLSPAFFEADADLTKGLQTLADKIAAAGVKRIEGNLIGDESYFSGEAIGDSWEWDDLQWYDGASVSALTFNDNAFALTVKPTTANAACAVEFKPAIALVSFVNRCVTIAANGTKSDLTIHRALGSDKFEIYGSLPVGDKGFEGQVAVPRPAENFVNILQVLLRQRGVSVNGQTKVVNAKDKTFSTVAPPAAAPQIEIVRLESPPLSVVAAKTLKPSQNLYTELILRALGEAVGDKTNPKLTSAQRGAGVVKQFLQKVGIAPDAIVQWDGSGLSRHNLITPAAAVELYGFMLKHPYSLAFQNALPIGGVDGTLRNRFKNTAAQGNVHAKTGTLDQVASLSGYVNTASGERLVFSILTNQILDLAVRRQTIDEIVVLLANFNGKTQ